MKSVRVVWSSLLLVAAAGSAVWAEPTQFETLEEALQELGDFSRSNGTFGMMVEPSCVRLSFTVVPRDRPEVIREGVQRAILYGVYRGFIHTKIDEILVYSIPLQLAIGIGQPAKVLESYAMGVRIFRERALALAKKHLGIASLSELVTTKEVSDMVLKDQWAPKWDRVYFNDQGEPGLDAFFTELVGSDKVSLWRRRMLAQPVEEISGLTPKRRRMLAQPVEEISGLTLEGQAVEQALREGKKCTATWGKDSSKAGQDTRIFGVKVEPSQRKTQYQVYHSSVDQRIWVWDFRLTNIECK